MKRALAAAITAVCLILAGCGGSSAHHCAGHDYATSCALRNLKAPAVQFGLTPALQGVDFAWTKVAASQAGSFGASYLSSDPSKDWTSSLITSYHQAHKGTVAVYETSATRALSGCTDGAADARFSEGLLNSWGYRRAHFDMAVDFDATQAQIQGPVYQYFKCANQAEPGLVGAYGDYYVIRYLASQGVVHQSWQTYAWSGGLWRPASEAPLEQYLNGNTFDHDRALAADYGQFPAPHVARPLPVCIQHRMSRKACSEGKQLLAKRQRALKSTSAALARIEADLSSHNCRRPYRREICRLNGRTRRTLVARFDWFTGHARTLAASL